MSPVSSIPSSAGPQELPPRHFLSVFALQVAITGVSVKFTVKISCLGGECWASVWFGSILSVVSAGLLGYIVYVLC